MNHLLAEQKRLLAVLAHPDDETFGMGGTLAKYAQEGSEVYLVCATRGEAGDVEEKYLRGFNSIAERREDELRCAAEKLGLKGVYFLNYRDSGMPGSPDNQHPQALVGAPIQQVALDICAYIRRLRPQVVITFDPIGGYRHPDHIAIHNATVRAFEMAGDPGISLGDSLPPYQPQKLYFHTIPKMLLRVTVFLLKLLGKDPHKFGRNADIDLASIAEVSFPTHAVIDFTSVRRLREEAAACHASQGGESMNKGFSGWIRKLFASRETFMQAYPPPKKNKPCRDLFDHCSD